MSGHEIFLDSEGKIAPRRERDGRKRHRQDYNPSTDLSIEDILKKKKKKPHSEEGGLNENGLSFKGKGKPTPRSSFLSCSDLTLFPGPLRLLV